ncbi:MAG: ATP synthase F1 subunit gamma [Oscillospiraceae bacterium]|nr:ATP synthase F1 subunit gamma [Oscillospiraceae bacterium]
MGANNIKKLKNRIKSVSSTRHLTKAMEIVAASKLKAATIAMENGRSYFYAMQDAIPPLAAAGDASIYTTVREVKRSCFVVIAGDRGLAGGYNNNIFKLAVTAIGKRKCVVLPIGKKSLDYFSGKGYDILSSSFSSVERIALPECARMGRQLAEFYARGEIDEVIVVYTVNHNILSQEPTMVTLLPIQKSSEVRDESVLFEPSAAAVADAVIPDYLGGMLYGAVKESFASELAARRMAMDSAYKNAGEMIDQLNLEYNRARQGAITQELTEIIGGTVE